MRQSYKTDFIAAHGQSMWNLRNDHATHGNRSPEAINAERLYSQYQQGHNGDTWTIYAISKGSHIVYVGRTGQKLAARWNNHKSHARNSVGTMPLHLAMLTTTDTNTFPEWTVQILSTTKDKNVAIQLEKLAIVEHETHIHGYNIRIGGGSATKKFMKATI